MERFLAQCAQYIFQKHADELREICLVFPNRRSGVFFNSYLQKQITDAVIGPETTTVGELISGCSDLQTGEKLHLISILYDVFKKHTQTTETFDEFYFWGEILLADFNDIDRYLVNAMDIFRNVADIKEIDRLFDYLSPEQKLALEHFWGSVAVTGRKEFQQKHIAIWEKLYPVYTEFKEILSSNNLAFGGMIDRQVVERMHREEIGFVSKKYYVVGLNALNACEKSFFREMQKRQKAEFLWDYDQFYLDDKNNGAGRFIRENLLQFPPPADFVFDREIFRQPKNVKLVAVSSNYGQSQQIPNFLNETETDFAKEFDNTAIVLADETLLFSALGAIPPDIGTINVTMGYPVKNSMIYGFLLLLVNLLKNTRIDPKRRATAYHRYVTDILNHQLLADWENDKNREFLYEIQARNKITIALDEIDFSPLHKIIFSAPLKVEGYSAWFLSVLSEIYRKVKLIDEGNAMLLEIIYSIYQTLENLGAVIQSVSHGQQREISSAVYFRLFTQHLGNVSVAFEGEPLSGIQVMGILETRCLDFKNLIILGLNENKWPRTFTAPSFIPANIRKGFGLPGIDEQDAMYSYYFYRLVQRAKNVTATYSVIKEGIGTGELSRYGYQLQYDSMHRPEKTNLDFHFANDPAKPISVASSEEIVRQLLAKNTLDHPLSPSAINMYLKCSLQFYFRYVVGLPEPDEVQEEIDGMIFGNIFHDTMETLYQPLLDKVMNRSDIENISKNKVLLENKILKKIAKNYFKEDENSRKPVVLEGKSVLVYENMKTYLKQLFKLDAQLAPFTLLGLEKEVKIPVEINCNGRPADIIVGGTIDRIDRKEETTRIVDYKTGNVKSFSFKSLEELFKRNEKDPKKEILQALIYAWVFTESEKIDHVQPAIYSLRKFFDENFNPNIRRDGREFYFQDVKNEFVESMKKLLAEIFSTENTFTQTPHTDHCKYCAYREICQRF